MEVVYEIDLAMTNEIAKNFSRELSSYVQNNCLLPAEKVYTKLLVDWSGFAAQTHLAKIYKLKENYLLLNNCLTEIGNEISKVVEKVAKADRDAGGTLLPLEIDNVQIISDNGLKETYVDENVLTITEVSKNQIDVLIETIYEIETIISKIETEKNNLNFSWKVGSGKSTIIGSIDDILNNLLIFKTDSLSLIDSLINVKTTLLESGSENNTSGGGGGGSSDTKQCQHCAAIIPKASVTCPSCNKTI